MVWTNTLKKYKNLLILLKYSFPQNNCIQIDPKIIVVYWFDSCLDKKIIIFLNFVFIYCLFYIKF